MSANEPAAVPAYVGLGSNLHDPLGQIQKAFDLLATLPRTQLVERSSLYRSNPLGPQDQPDFINAVAKLVTSLDARELLREMKKFELQLGRDPSGVRWGPRVIDFDLLMYGGRRIDEPELKVPHPGIQARDFVLYPLAEIAPELDVPGAGRVSELLRKLPASAIEKLPGSAGTPAPR